MRLLFCTVAWLMVFGMFAASCDESPTSPGSDVTFRPIVSGFYSLHPLEGALVIRSADAWKTVLEQLQPMQPPASVDFTTEMLLLIQAGQRSSSGYSVRVERIVQKDSALVIDAVERRPGRGCITLTVMTRPYEVVALPPSHLSPTLNWAYETQDCSQS